MSIAVLGQMAMRALPGLGRIAGTARGAASSPIGRSAIGGMGAGIGAAAVTGLFGGADDVEYRPRRRSRGFSARDIRQARKLVRLANDFSCPGSKSRKAGKKSCR